MTRILWDHASLAVSTIDPAIAFFEAGFGFRVTFVERGMSGQIASMLGHPGATCDLVQLTLPDGGPKLELIAFSGTLRPSTSQAEPLGLPVPPGAGHVAFRSTTFDATLRRLLHLGAERVGAVTNFSDGRSVYLRTPFGAFVELEEQRQGNEGCI